MPLSPWYDTETVRLLSEANRRSAFRDAESAMRRAQTLARMDRLAKAKPRIPEPGIDWPLIICAALCAGVFIGFIAMRAAMGAPFWGPLP